jgi:hypothetical protein
MPCDTVNPTKPDSHAADASAPKAEATTTRSVWQPIETAPRDGQMILLWVRAVRYGEDDDGRPFESDCSSVDFGQWRELPDCDGYVEAFASPHGDAEHITHWMPLPAAPGAPVWLCTCGTPSLPGVLHRADRPCAAVADVPESESCK